NGVLTISGERKLEKEEQGKKFHRIERAYGRFVRSFVLPDNVDPTKVTASMNLISPDPQPPVAGCASPTAEHTAT
ncbi:Hsp20/alpha crystallin family protein, partial [Cutibacterium acnes]